MAKQKIEIDVPEGYRVAGSRLEQLIMSLTEGVSRIVIDLQKVRFVTSSDMGSVVEANNDGNDRWCEGLYVGRLSNGKHVIEQAGTVLTYDRVRVLDVPSANVLDVPSEADNELLNTPMYVLPPPHGLNLEEIAAVIASDHDQLAEAVAEVFEGKEPEPHWDGYRLATEADIGSVVEVSDYAAEDGWIFGRTLESINPAKECRFRTYRDGSPNTECSWAYARVRVGNGSTPEATAEPTPSPQFDYEVGEGYRIPNQDDYEKAIEVRDSAKYDWCGAVLDCIDVDNNEYPFVTKSALNWRYARIKV